MTTFGLVKPYSTSGYLCLMLYSIVIVILALLIRRLCTLSTSLGRLWLSASRTETLFHSTLLVTGVHFSRTRLKKDERREEGFLIQRHRSFRTASSTSKRARTTPRAASRPR